MKFTTLQLSFLKVAASKTQLTQPKLHVNLMNEFMTNDAKNVVKEGIVYKKGEGFIAGWKERMFDIIIK